MSFARPELLWGLAALLLPWLLSLLGRGRPALVAFPGFALLRETLAEATRFSRRRALGELLLRSMLLAALVIVLAGPRFDAARDAAAPLERDLVIVLDDSASMARPFAGGPGSRLERAGALARDLIARLGPGRQAALLRLSAPDAPELGTPARIDRALTDPWPRPVDGEFALPRALAAARRCFPRSEGDAARAAPGIVLFSDGGARLFGAGPPADLDRRELTLLLLAGAGDPAPALRFDDASSRRVGGSEGARALVTQDGGASLLTASPGGAGVVFLESGAESSVLRWTFAKPGQIHGWVSIKDRADPLARAPFAMTGRPPRRVALISEAPDHPTSSLWRALLTGREDGLGARLHVAGLPGNVRADELSTFDALVLTRGCSDAFPLDSCRALLDAGGTLVVLPHPDRARDSLRPLAGLAPLEIGDELAGRWTPRLVEDALKPPLSPAQERDFAAFEREGRVYRAVTLTPLGNTPASPRTLLALASLGDDGSAGPSGELPLLLECRVGAGRVLIFAAPLLSLPGEPIFSDLDPYWWVPLLHRMLDQAAPEQLFPRRIAWGETVALDPGRPGLPNRYRLVRLGSDADDLTLDERRPVLRFTEWAHLGAYQVLVAQGERVRDLGAVEVALPPEEHFERPGDAATLASWGLPTLDRPDPNALAAALADHDAQGPTAPFWWLFVLALFALEALLPARR